VPLGSRLLRVLAVWPSASRLPDARLPSACGGWGVPAAASPPVGSPPQYSPALRWVTTGFGMGPGGASTLSATGTPHPRHAGTQRVLGCATTPRERSRSWRVARAPCSVPHHGSPVDGSPVGPARGRGSALPRVRAAPRPRHDPGWERYAGCSPSTIRTARLQSVTRGPPAAYQPGHLPGVLPLSSGDARLGEGFPLRCFQRFARPHVATQRCRSRDNWRTSGASTPVLSY
jgi:hypothetical protein